MKLSDRMFNRVVFAVACVASCAIGWAIGDLLDLLGL